MANLAVPDEAAREAFIEFQELVASPPMAPSTARGLASLSALGSAGSIASLVFGVDRHDLAGIVMAGIALVLLVCALSYCSNQLVLLPRYERALRIGIEGFRALATDGQDGERAEAIEEALAVLARLRGPKKATWRFTEDLSDLLRTDKERSS